MLVNNVILREQVQIEPVINQDRSLLYLFKSFEIVNVLQLLFVEQRQQKQQSLVVNTRACAFLQHIMPKGISPGVFVPGHRGYMSHHIQLRLDRGVILRHLDCPVLLNPYQGEVLKHEVIFILILPRGRMLCKLFYFVLR